MIEIGVALAAIKSAHGALMSAVKVGKDLSQLGTAISKYAKGEAALQAKAEAKKSSFFSKLSGVENSAIDEFMHKRQQDEMRDQLRETFQLYGKKGLKKYTYEKRNADKCGKILGLLLLLRVVLV